MAIVTTKSAVIAGRDSIPPNKGTITQGYRTLYEDPGIVTVNNGDSIGSKYIMASVPSSASLSNLSKLSGALTSAAANLGVYRTTQDGSAAVNATLFASAVSLATADAVGTNLLHSNGNFPLTALDQPLWQVLGLTADPNVMYDIAFVLTAAATATGTLVLRVVYNQGN